jgi:phosphoglycolate phosphatase-like HAD superfamily hydrolase
MKKLPQRLSKYATWLIDCDGVLLDSNRLKTEAFFEIAGRFGQDVAQEFVDYHVANGGISRHVKFRYLQEVLLKRTFDENLHAALLREFSDLSKAKLLECKETDGCSDFLNRAASGSRLFVVSGGDERDLRQVFSNRGLSQFFAGIYGSPRTKFQIIDHLKLNSDGKDQTAFVGDSKVDHEAALYADADFFFLHGYSEMRDWRAYAAAHPSMTVARSFRELMDRVD